MSMRPASAVTVLVDDQTLTMVSAVHGFVFAASAWPPQMSTTVSPPMSMAIAAPVSSPSAIARPSASATLAKRASQCPWTSSVIRS